MCTALYIHVCCVFNYSKRFPARTYTPRTLRYGENPIAHLTSAVFVLCVGCLHINTHDMFFDLS